MFRWPQNGRSRSTESSNLSGKEFFLPSTAAKTDDQYAFMEVLNVDCGYKAASQTLENSNVQ